MAQRRVGNKKRLKASYHGLICILQHAPARLSAVTCGCDRSLDGAPDEGAALCTKYEGFMKVCRHAQEHPLSVTGYACPSDMSLCAAASVATVGTCEDSMVGKWARPKKCRKKANKGKCRKKKVRENCARTCNLCSQG